MKKSLIIIALFILFVNNYLAGSELEISYDDTDFYQQLFGIFTRYNPDSLWLASFPISAEECLLELDILKEKQLTEKELYVIDNLREKVQFYNNNKGLRLNYFGYLESEYHDLKNSCFEYINQDEINYSYHTWLDLEGFFTPIPDLKIYGKVRLGLVDSFTVSYLRSWFDYMYGTLESGYLHYSKGGFEILFGRQTPRIGPLFSEGLLLSGETAPYNLIKLKYKTGRFYLQYFTAKLDNYRAEPDSLLHKYISSHRVGFKYKGLEVGMTELALYARESTPEWYYLNPLTVYYFEQWNHRDYDDNLFIGLDFIYTHPPFPQVYGELMIDDFQIDFFSEPHEAGWKLGLNYAPHFFKDLFMNFEYARVSNWVYSQEEPQNYFIYYDEPIGFPLGCDVDRLKFSLKYQILKNLYSRVRYSYTRKGEGKIYRDFEGAVPETEFPSGLVDKTSQIAIGLTWKPVSWITANSYLDYSSITDLEHGLSEWSVCECDLKKYELGINLNLYY